MKNEVMPVALLCVIFILFVLTVGAWVGVGESMYALRSIRIDPPEANFPVDLESLGLLSIFACLFIVFHLAGAGLGMSFWGRDISHNTIVRKISAVFVYINSVMVALTICTSIIFVIYLKFFS